MHPPKLFDFRFFRAVLRFQGGVCRIRPLGMMHHILTLPVPSDVDLPNSILLTNSQSSEEILNLTAVPPDTELKKTSHETHYPPETPVTELFFPTAPGVPRSIHRLNQRGVLVITHHQTSIAISLHHDATQPSYSDHVLTLLNYLFNTNSARVQPSPFTREWTFDAVRRTISDHDITEYQDHLSHVLQLNSLNVTLRPYQHRAVAWMLSRERDVPSKPFMRRVGDFTFDPLTQQVTISADDSSKHDAHHVTDALWHGRGGLLCDEMGLGKTVELMQLVLCNPCTEPIPQPKSRNPLICVSCRGTLVEQGLQCAECGGGWHKFCARQSAPSIKDALKRLVCEKCTSTMANLCHESTPVSQLPATRATLVVVPTALLRQWVSELRKHVKDSLNIVIFRGMKAGYVAQKTLQVADVVLTTYDALRADVHAARAIKTPRAMGRYEKRFPAAPIPLLSLHWHRVAFDESQMLSARKSTAAEMAGFLHAKYRWCVTGTPMRSSLTDAACIFEMLHLMYNGVPINWSTLFQPSCYSADKEELKVVLRRVMWRTSKADIGPDELDLPPQNVEHVFTRLGPVEMYHYQSLLQNVRTVIGKYKTHMSDKEMKVSRELITMLRQACTHPQIGVSGRRLLTRANRTLGEGNEHVRSKRENAVQKAKKKAENPLDMSEVLDALVAKANLESCDALRSLVASINGLAAVCLLKFSLLPIHSPIIEGLVKAIQLYREVLRVSDENQHVAKLDEIQLMHVLFNLNDAFESVEAVKAALRSAPGTERRKTALKTLATLGRTTREGQLLEQTDELREKYVSDARVALSVTSAIYKNMVTKLGDEPLIMTENEEEEESDEDESEEKLFERVAVEQRRGNSPWWEVALAALLENKQEDKFLNRVVERLLEALPGRGVGAKTVANRLRSFYSISIVISSELRELQSARDKFRKALTELPGSRDPTAQEISDSGQCHECREFGTGPKCEHCRSEHVIIDVERYLYSLQDEVDGWSVVQPRYTEDPDDAEDDDFDTYQSHRDPRMIVNSVFIPQSRSTKSASSVLSRIRYVSEVEIILKSLSGVVRKTKDEERITEMDAWFQRWEDLKEEHATARKLFEAQRSYLATLDEVKMALMRLSVLEDNINVSTLSELEARHRVPRGSLSPLQAQFEAEKVAAEAEFCTKRGSVVYLRSLKKDAAPQAAGKRKQDGLNGLSSCPICLLQFDESLTRVAVMTCGHVFCCDCMLAMIKKVNQKHRMTAVACPTCRTKCPVDEINFTTTTPQPSQKKPRSNADSKSPSADSGDVTELELENGENITPTKESLQKIDTRSSFYDSSETVRGHFGAKVSATLRLIHGIRKSDGSSKILIFSEWNEVLALMAHSLTTNGLFFCDGAKQRGPKAFADVVENFKTSDYINIILLPLRRAGAGLNLTEAQHVILMEPSMNVSLEAQAVGRVHRIGQEKITYVHRVMVNYTIEDKILSLGDQIREQKSGKGGSIALSDAIGAIHERLDAEVQEDVEVLEI